MKITELLKPESIALGVKASSKDEIIDCLTGLMEQGGRLNDRAGYKEGILAREALGSTAIGEGIAIPHAKVAAVKEPGLAAVTVPEGVDYEAFDGSLANLIFMIAAPDGEADTHLEALSKLSTLLMNPGFKDALIAAKTKEEFLQIIDDTEKCPLCKETGGAGISKISGCCSAEGCRDRADAATVRISSSCCNCLPHRHCPYLYGSGKPGKYGTKVGNSIKGRNKRFCRRR